MIFGHSLAMYVRWELLREHWYMNSGIVLLWDLLCLVLVLENVQCLVCLHDRRRLVICWVVALCHAICKPLGLCSHKGIGCAIMWLCHFSDIVCCWGLCKCGAKIDWIFLQLVCDSTLNPHQSIPHSTH